MRASVALWLAAVTVFAACTAGSSPSPSPSTSPAPSGAAFTVEVSPPEDPPEVRMAIPGQRVVFLVIVSDSAGAAPVTISAAATKATVKEIRPTELEPGVVGEVWVEPDPASAETTASVEISATRDGASQTVARSIPVFPMIDERANDARPHFERWIAWLASAQPELGIDQTTTWEPAFVSTLLVVSHYAYWSDEWEMTIAWHNMIAPSDWSEVHLRERGVDVAPSIAFRTDSVTQGSEPYEITPPEVVVR